MKYFLFLTIALLFWFRLSAQIMFSDEILNNPQGNSTELEVLFKIIEVPEFIKNTSPSFAYLENGYALATILNKENWTTLMNTRQATEIFIVYTKYPQAKEDWLINYHALLAARLKELFAIDPSLNNKNIQWKIYLQTACPTKELAESMFHGIVIKHVPKQTTNNNQVTNNQTNNNQVTNNQTNNNQVTNNQTNNNQTNNPTNNNQTNVTNPQEIISKINTFIAQEGGATEQTVYQVFDRHREWKNALVVMDWTGSMYTNGALAVKWHTEHLQQSGIKYITFFNDGDNKRTAQKAIGRTGGIYFSEVENLNAVLDLFTTVKEAGDGGETEENDIEALVEAIKKYPTFDELILIADNTSCVRDIDLLYKIRFPVRVILCGYNEMTGVNPQYVDVAMQTNGSLHTINQDLMDMQRGFQQNFRITIGREPEKMRIGNHPCSNKTAAEKEAEKLRVVEDRSQLARLDKLRKVSEFFSYEDLLRSKVFPNLDEALKRAAEVYIVRMSYQNLDAVSPYIARLANLQVLFLEYNNISALCPEIKELKFLQYINLANNKFTFLPLELTELKHLQILDLSNNQLKALPQEIEQMKNLELLYLGGNPIPETEKARIKQLLPNCAIFYNTQP